MLRLWKPRLSGLTAFKLSVRRPLSLPAMIACPKWSATASQEPYLRTNYLMVGLLAWYLRNFNKRLSNEASNARRSNQRTYVTQRIMHIIY